MIGLRNYYANENISFINAGLGATTSEMGVYRLSKDLLMHQPDIIFIDFSVNDSNTMHFSETYEGLVKQIMSNSNETAIVLLIMARKDWSNASFQHFKVGLHYNIPIVNLADAVWFTLQTEEATWEDLYSDDVHPNDMGHQFIADVLLDFFDVLSTTNSGEYEREKVNVVRPLFGRRYANVSMILPGEINIDVNNGFELIDTSPRFKDACLGQEMGDSIVFSITGKHGGLLYLRNNKSGIINLSIDDSISYDFDCFISHEIGYQNIFNFRELENSNHKVKIKITGKNPKSLGHEFQINPFLNNSLDRTWDSQDTLKLK